jgi:hypothetical protein
VFGATIAHCEELCRQFVESGVMAQCFTSDTNKGEREELLKEYRKADSTLRVLISVEALAKGFDVQDVGCVVDCRPLRKSLSTAIQMWGRGLRASPETGKTDCLLLDHSGNILRFAEDFTDIFYNGLSELDCGEKLDKAVRKEPEEGDREGMPGLRLHAVRQAVHVLRFRDRQAGRRRADPGHMREVMIGKAKAAENHEHLWQQACAYARAHGKPETMQGRAAHIFKDIVGDWPPRGWHIERTQGAEISRAVLNKIRQKNIAFAAAAKARDHATAQARRAGGMSFALFARAHGLEVGDFHASDRIQRCATTEHPRSKNGAFFWDGSRGWVFAWDGEAKTQWYDDPNAKPWTDEEKRAWAVKRRPCCRPAPQARERGATGRDGPAQHGPRPARLPDPQGPARRAGIW